MTTALITGASAGIGAEFARQLAADGHDLVLVARTPGPLETLAHQLRYAHGIRVEVLPADLADRAQVETVARRLREEGERAVDLLVNNAGFGLKTSFLNSAVADEERAVEVMCRAVLVLSHAAALAMRARGRGQIINVSSVASFLPMGTYSAAKAWATAFTQGLAIELEGTGVGVTALCPGYTHTEFHERAGIPMGSVPEAMWLDADRLVRDALADARKGRVLSVPGPAYKVVGALTGALPRAALHQVSALVLGKRGKLPGRLGGVAKNRYAGEHPVDR